MFSWRLRYDTDQLFRTFFLSLVGTKILYEEFFKHFYIWTKIVLIIQLSPKVMLCLKWLHLCKKFEWKVCLHYFILFFTISSVQFSCSIVSKSLQPHGLQHARLPCPSPTPRACSDLRPSSQWCHPTISSSVVPFSCLQSFPASRSFLMSQLFASGDQSIRASASASVLPMNIQTDFL